MSRNEPELTSIARSFHAFADPTRLQIIELLLSGERCVCELTDSLRAAQSRLSFHLKVLREAGLVSDRRDGRWVYYTLLPDAVEEMAEYLRAVRPEAIEYPVNITRRNSLPQWNG